MADNKYNYQGSSGSSSGSGRDHSGGRRGRGRGHRQVQGSPHNPSMPPPQSRTQSPPLSSYNEPLAAGGRRSITAQPQDVSLSQSPISSTEVGSGSGSGQVKRSHHSVQNPSLQQPQLPSLSPPPKGFSYSQALLAGSRRPSTAQRHSLPQSPIQMAARSQPQGVSSPQSRISCTEVGSGSGSGQVQSSYRSIRSSTVQRDSLPQSPIQMTVSEEKLFPVPRPDEGGKFSDKSISLLANHFRVNFDSKAAILEYEADIAVRKGAPEKNLPLKTRDKSKKRLLIEKLFRDNVFAYDGKSIFSATTRDTGEFRVDVPGCEGTSARTFIFNIREKQKLELKALDDFLSERNSEINIRPVLQGLDIVMRENPARSLIQVGRNFYKTESTGEDLGYGTKVHTGFKQSLKPTSNGVALCLDYSAAAFYEEIPVFDFLKLNVEGFKGENDVIGLRPKVEKELRGLKVRETLSEVKRKYTIAGLTAEATRILSFKKEGEEQETTVVDHFQEKYMMEISNHDIPCLNLGSTRHPIYMPIQFCKLAEGQPCFKDGLKLQTVSPGARKYQIYKAVRDTHGSSSDRAVTGDLKIKVVNDMMTRVDGRVIHPPKLKLLSKAGKPLEVPVDAEKRHWNYHNKIFVDGVKVESWALINFLKNNEGHKVSTTETFIQKLKARSRNLGMQMNDPVFCENRYDMTVFSSANDIQNVLQGVVDGRSHLQMIVCILSGKHNAGYSRLKWISETKMGVMTQCCRYDNYLSCKNKETYLDNLSMKINQKVGGRNMELHELLPGFRDKTSCMFIGADVNHPAANDQTGKSIAAVVGTVNWPADRYIARIEGQTRRKEEIQKFGEMCKDLIGAFSKFNEKKKPDRIVVFRDGVGEGQFDMVLEKELLGLKREISDDNYNPKVTVIVAQKRHHTRLFLEEKLFPENRWTTVNVPPGTVVDTVIVHPLEFDFYLCSHKGTLGTSKPTHYHVLHDENEFTSDELQQFIYHLCFTFARCTKPVSLVPPILYADQAAYRGRMFHDASSKETENAGDDSDPCKLHERVKNEMFFL